MTTPPFYLESMSYMDQDGNCYKSSQIANVVYNFFQSSPIRFTFRKAFSSNNETFYTDFSVLTTEPTPRIFKESIHLVDSQKEQDSISLTFRFEMNTAQKFPFKLRFNFYKKDNLVQYIDSPSIHILPRMTKIPLSQLDRFGMNIIYSFQSSKGLDREKVKERFREIIDSASSEDRKRWKVFLEDLSDVEK